MTWITCNELEMGLRYGYLKFRPTRFLPVPLHACRTQDGRAGFMKEKTVAKSL